jgi:hypothetical protein
MQNKITLVIDKPVDADAFEAEVPDLITVASALPEPAHRTLDLYFDDYDSASRAVSTPQAGAFFAKLAETGVTFLALFSAVENY